ncbi:hypothetical protein [Brevundimonas naejangsanensis]
MIDPMELVGRLDGIATDNRDTLPPITHAALTEAAACIREMVAQRAGLYDAVSLGFYDGFRDAITRDPWEDCYDYAASKGADYAKAAMSRILAKQAADPSRRLNPLPPAPGAEDE